MKTIDHRILIPSLAEPVWEIISDISRNPDWQVGCREVIFLTSKRSGAGLRWRYSDDKRREFVYETSAWYPGLGYEYYFIDGALYRDARCRLRLQETPEGTIVQWTVSYEFAGILGGSHNALDNMMRDSLRQLYSLFKNRRELHEQPSKSLIRDAPDASARSAYQPRHAQPDGRTQPAVVSPPRPQPPPAWLEPPLAPSDTRPNPAAHTASSAVANILGPDFEPEFLDDLREMARFEPPPPAEATQPSGGRIIVPESDAIEPTTSIPTPPSTPRIVLKADKAETAAAIAFEQQEPDFLAQIDGSTSSHDTQPVVSLNLATSPEPERTTTPPDIVSPPTAAPNIAAIVDTRSIWEIFNVPRPDNRVIESSPAPEPEEPAPEPPVMRPLPELHDAPAPKVALLSGTRGLRQTLRLQSVRVRRPF